MNEIKNRWGLKHSVVLMRIFIGWHFLYEGIIKLYNPEWTSFGYIASAQGPLKPLFKLLTSEPVLGVVDVLNMGALIIVGITLTIGIYEKLGAIIGMALLAVYYLAHPSLPWLMQVNVEGSYWFVNKNLIELAACLVIYHFPTGQYFGLERILKKSKK